MPDIPYQPLNKSVVFPAAPSNIEAPFVLASAARTTSTNTADQTNLTGRGIIVYLDITVSTTGTVSIRVEGKDPGSGNYVQLNVAPTAVGAVGTYGYEIVPGGSTAGTAGAGNVNQRTAAGLPRTFRIRVVHTDATSITYSVSWHQIP